MRRPPHPRSHAFTTLEVVVVIVVLAVLATLAVPTFGAVVDRSLVEREGGTYASVMREATALARLDGRDEAGPYDVFLALQDLQTSAAEGIQAAAEAGDMVLYTQSEWNQSPTVPSGKRAFVFATNDLTQMSGLATMSTTVANTCVMVRLGAGGSPVSFSATVASMQACDGNLALAGPQGGDVGLSPIGNGGRAAIVYLLGTSAAAWDDVSVTDNASSTYISDNFNRANGPVGGGWTTIGDHFGTPQVSNNVLIGPGEVPSVAYVDVPDSAARINAKVAALPNDDEAYAGIGFADLSTVGSETQAQVSGRGGGTLLSVPGVLNTYVGGAFFPVSVGQTVSVVRTDSNVSSVLVDGAQVASADRRNIGAITGTVTGVANPLACRAAAFPAEYTQYDGAHEYFGANSLNSNGSFTLYALSTTPAKVVVVCPEGATLYGVGGTMAWGDPNNAATATPVTAVGGGTVSLGNISFGAVWSSVPEAPTSLTAAAVDGSASTMVLSWPRSVTPVSSYRVYRNATATGSPIYEGSATTLTDSGLTGGTSYTYSIVASNNAGQSSAVRVSNAATTAPATPSIATFATSGTSYSGTYSATATSTSYQIQVTNNAGATVADTSGVTSGSFSAAPGTTSERYQARVRSVNASGLRSAWSSWSAFTAWTTPSVPSIGATSVAGNSYQYRVAFTNPNGTATNTVKRWTQNVQNWTTIASGVAGAAGAGGYTDTTGANSVVSGASSLGWLGFRQVFVVQACNSNGCSGDSGQVAAASNWYTVANLGLPTGVSRLQTSYGYGPSVWDTGWFRDDMAGWPANSLGINWGTGALGYASSGSQAGWRSDDIADTYSFGLLFPAYGCYSLGMWSDDGNKLAVQDGRWGGTRQALWGYDNPWTLWDSTTSPAGNYNTATGCAWVAPGSNIPGYILHREIDGGSFMYFYWSSTGGWNTWANTNVHRNWLQRFYITG